MNPTATVYGRALYTLAQEEGVETPMLQQLETLRDCFSREPAFLRLLAAPELPKEERRGIVDSCFRGRAHPYVVNFLKLLLDKGNIPCFGDCVRDYRARYNETRGILPVTAVTAVPLNGEQRNALTEKLARLTGKTICLENRVDPACLGGVRLDYGGVRVDGTLARGLELLYKRIIWN